MKKLLTLSLLLIAFCSYSQPTIELKQDTPKGIYKLELTTTPSPDPCVVCGGVKSIIVDPVTGIMQVTYFDGTIYNSPSMKGKDGKTPKVGNTTTVLYPSPAKVTQRLDTDGTPIMDFEIPQGQPGGNTGGGGSDNAINKVFNVVAYGAKGDGVTDDWQAFQNCFNAAIDAKGKVVIPPPPVRYRVNRTIDCSRDQFWLYVEMQARRGQGIVYMGPSGSPLIRINGQKGGWWRGLEAKIGDDSPQGQSIQNSAVVHITTEGTTSTAGFSFYDCTLETNKGQGNGGVLLGKAGSNGDISQIHFINCTVWGGGGQSATQTIPGQYGFKSTDGNTCQLSWFGGGWNHLNNGFELNAGTGFYFFSVGGSRNNIDFNLKYPSTITIDGNRFESGLQHIIQSGGGFAVITETNSLVSDYHPGNGRLYDMQSACSLSLHDIKMEQTMLDQRCIYLGGGGLGNLEVKGGAWQVSSADLITVENANNWRLDVKGVGKLDAQYNVRSQFPNR